MIAHVESPYLWGRQVVLGVAPHPPPLSAGHGGELPEVAEKNFGNFRNVLTKNFFFFYFLRG